MSLLYCILSLGFDGGRHRNFVLSRHARTAVGNCIRAGIPQRVARELTGDQTDAVFNRWAFLLRSCS
jgi:hypothetical protein